jgi:putative addiction module antidote
MTDERKPKGVAEAPPAGFTAETPKPKGLALKVRRIGNSLGVVLPKEVLAKLRVGEGDHLSVSDAPDGVTLRASNEALQEQIEAARRGMKRYRNALRELAK